jgi:hypothetical protein
MLKISQGVNNFSKVVSSFPLCNPCNHVAKCSKVWQTSGKLWELLGRGIGRDPGDYFPRVYFRSLELILEECCKNSPWQGEAPQAPGFRLRGRTVSHISGLEESLVFEYTPEGDPGV